MCVCVSGSVEHSSETSRQLEQSRVAKTIAVKHLTSNAKTQDTFKWNGIRQCFKNKCSLMFDKISSK